MSKVKTRRKSRTSRNGSVKKSKGKALPKRDAVKEADQWDLGSLYLDDATWESEFKEWEGKIPGYEKFKGKLGDGPEVLAECLDFDRDVDRQGERLGTYAFLKTSEDQSNSEYQRMRGRFQHVAAKAAEASSYIRPEILVVPPEKIERFL